MLKSFVTWILVDLWKLDLETKSAQALHFFFYDTIKILGLIVFVIGIIAFVRTFIDNDRLKERLSKQRYGLGNFLAACFGAISPFCSCSSIPLFLGFIEARLSVGLAFSFLIASPMINEVLFVIMGGTFGWGIATLYAACGIMLGTVVGILFDKMGLEKEVLWVNDKEAKTNQACGCDKSESTPKNSPCCGEKSDITYPHVGVVSCCPEEEVVKKSPPQTRYNTIGQRLKFAIHEAWTSLKKLWWIILIAVGVGAVIHTYVSPEFFVKFLRADSIFSVPVATLIGIPIYAGCSTIVPVAFAMTLKGIPLGTAMAFMMSVAGLSLPEALMLKSVLSVKLLALFYAVTTIGIIGVGYFFNALGL